MYFNDNDITILGITKVKYSLTKMPLNKMKLYIFQKLGNYILITLK